MRVLVCGGRDWADTALTYRVLSRLHKQCGFEVVIEGDARGADRMAGYWARIARLQNIKEKVTDADYAAHGRYKAPKVRNQRMLDRYHPDLVVAFPGGGGTADMVAKAQAAGVDVVQVSASGNLTYLVAGNQHCAVRG